MRLALTARTWNGRLWLAVAYVLATGLAQCAHRHGAGEDAAPTRCLASCDDERVHLSGHTSVDLGAHPDHCPACQFRTSHHAGRDERRLPFRSLHAGRVEAPRTAVASVRPAHRLSCRAPPAV